MKKTVKSVLLRCSLLQLLAVKLYEYDVRSQLSDCTNNPVKNVINCNKKLVEKTIFSSSWGAKNK